MIEIMIFIIMVCCFIIMPRSLICVIAMDLISFEVGAIPIILIAVYLDIYYLMLQKKELNLIK
jgi:hypothetical protein